MNNEVNNNVGENVVQSPTNPVVNNPNINNENLNSKGSKNTGLVIALSLLGVLIVGLIAFGTYYFLNKYSESENIYYQVIDNFASALETNINKLEVKPVKVNSNINVNLNSNDKEIKKIANIINNMELNLDFELDTNNKVSNMDYNIKYNKNDLLNLGIYLQNNDGVVYLGSLFNKNIKFTNEDDDLSALWTTIDKDALNVVVKELNKELKTSLNKKYFSTSKENITVLNKKVTTNKYTLTLVGKYMLEFQTNLLDNIKNNTDLINNLSKILNISNEDLIEEIETSKENLTEVTDTYIIDIYVNNKTYEIEKALININDEPLILEKSSQNTFDIIDNSNDENNKIGTLAVSDNSYKLSYDYEGVLLEFEFTHAENKEALTLKYAIAGSEIELTINSLDNSGNIVLKIDENGISSQKVSLEVTAKYEKEEISTVNSKVTNNYVDFDKLTESDKETILQNLYQNETLLSIIQDIVGE